MMRTSVFLACSRCRRPAYCWWRTELNARSESPSNGLNDAAGAAFPGQLAGEGLRRLVEAGGQLIHCFRSGLDYAFIPMPPRPATGCGACYPTASRPTWRILVPAPVLPPRRVYESLQGSPEVGPLATPRRCRGVPAASPEHRRVHRCELRCHPALASRRDHRSNPRPQVLDSRIYVRSSLIDSRLTLPEEQGRRSASGRCLLAEPPRRTAARDPVSASPGSPAQAPSGQRLGGIKPPERSCRRWQLSFCTVFNEGHAPRYAPEGSQPASKPVAPKQVPPKYSRSGPFQARRTSRAGSSAATR
ncbi:MAG: hypothetical protein CMLOHMNK_01928 [Steroidobacteraceae bacterium]|nr:hypothetical protein [Steroidobacteraceae bacterium]